MTRRLALPVRLRRLPWEAAWWTVALVSLACTDPSGEGLLRLCPLDWLGLTFCPGCGLGHGIAHLFRGDLAASVHAHPLAPLAVAVLSHRIARLVRSAWRQPSFSN